MRILVKVALATLVFFSLALVMLVLTGLVDSESAFGSGLRAFVGALLAVITFGWIRYVVKIVRGVRTGGNR